MKERSRSEQMGANLEDTTHEVFFPDPPEWQNRAACLGSHPDLFFPERGASNKEAKAICSGCGVREECLEFGMHERFGVYGGLSERERRRIRRARITQKKNVI